MTSESFGDSYSKYYNLLYQNKKYGIEADYVDRLIQKFYPRATNILEYGSGTGKHGIELKKKGYACLGVEKSSQMAAEARHSGYDCVNSDMIEFKSDKKFEVCLALFHVVSYINSNDQLITLFRNTKENLIPQGIFIFDVWYTPAVCEQKPEDRTKQMENDEIEIIRQATPIIDHINNIVTVHYKIDLKEKYSGEVKSFTENHPMRHFGIPEIDLLCKLTGFNLLKAEEFVTGKNPSIDTWGVNFIVRSNG